MTIPHRVHIHLGAHKTATTFIQNCLEQNKSLFLDRHILCVTPTFTRNGFMKCFRESIAGNAENQAELTEKMLAFIKAETLSYGFNDSQPTLLVISEENFLGNFKSLIENGRLYPELKLRLATLAKTFDGCEISVFVSIRHYCEFYPSAYLEALRNGVHRMSFEEFMANATILENSWLTMIDDICSVFDTVKVWPYEKFRENAQAILSELLDTPLSKEIIDINTLQRPSLSRKGLDIVMANKDKLSRLELTRLVDLIADQMVFDDPVEKLKITDQWLIDRLNTQYQAELNKLSRYLIVK